MKISPYFVSRSDVFSVGFWFREERLRTESRPSSLCSTGNSLPIVLTLACGGLFLVEIK